MPSITEESSYHQFHDWKFYLDWVTICLNWCCFFFPISPNFLELRNFWEILFLADMFLDSDNQNKNKQFLMFLKTITLPIFFQGENKACSRFSYQSPSLPPSYPYPPLSFSLSPNISSAYNCYQSVLETATIISFLGSSQHPLGFTLSSLLTSCSWPHILLCKLYPFGFLLNIL